VRIRGNIERLEGQNLIIKDRKQADGSLTAARVNVGMKGQVPPM